MSTETITFINFLVHSLVIGAAAWLLVRFVIRDALRRCILANLAVLMCLYSPFDITFRDLFPPQKHVPVLTPIRETFEHDWRVKVEPQKAIANPTAAPAVAPSWNGNDVVKWLHRLSWLVTALLLLRLMIQSIRLQRWAWSLRYPAASEYDKLPDDVKPERIRVFDGECTPCVAGWFFPVIAVPAKAFQELTPQQWRWLIRHESEHLRTNDTVAVLLQNIALAFLWWNPFTHALIEEYARAREQACDAAAVGEEPDHTPYADFLLAWAAKPSPSRFAMSIARSRPARRLQDRLVALMEARGVRKKVGALFMLGCAAFAVIAPFVAASFGIATASAQPAESSDKAPVMFTRLYRVAPDFLTDADTARSKLEKQGITFPEGASALFQPATSSLIVRHYPAALDQIEAVIDRLHHRLPQVYLQCMLIQAEKHLSQHEAILKPEETKKLLEKHSRQKGFDLMSAPNVTTRMGQRATVEVTREILPPKPWDKLDAIDIKHIGPRIHLTATPAPDGKASIEAKVELGVDLDSAHPWADQPWLPEKDAKTNWSRVQTFTTASKATLASAETLVLHLTAAKKPVTVLIIAEALNPQGQKAISFESTATEKPSSTGIDVPDKTASEWAVRVYDLPRSFPEDKPPVEVLKAAGIPFPKGADTSLKDGKLTIRNTKANLELIDVWLDALNRAENPKSVVVTAKAIEFKGDFLKRMNEWLPPPPTPTGTSDVLPPTAPPPALMRHFTLSSIVTDAQLQVLMKNISVTPGVEMEHLGSKAMTKEPLTFELPAFMKGRELKIESVIGPDGYSIDMTVRTPPQDENPASGITTSVTIWDGQTLILGSQASEGVSRLLFITGSLIEKRDKK